MRGGLCNALLLALSLLGLHGCGANTSIYQEWQAEPEQRAEAYNTIFVVSMAEDEKDRLQVETALAQALRAEGARAIRSLDKIEQMPGALAEDLGETILEAAREAEASAVLIATLQDVDVQMKRSPAPMVSLHPHGTYFNSLGAYWLHQNQILYAPAAGSDAAVNAIAGVADQTETGAIDFERSYLLETSLYDARTDKPIWIARSETLHSDNLEQAITNYAQTVAQALSNKDLLIPKDLE